MPPRPVTEAPTPDRSYNSEPLPWQTASWAPAAAADSGAGAAPSARPVLDPYAGLRHDPRGTASVHHARERAPPRRCHGKDAQGGRLLLSCHAPCAPVVTKRMIG